jgi:hypothetical protein
LAKAIELLPPARALEEVPGQPGRRIQLQDAEVVCDLGVITTMRAQRLDYGPQGFRSGDSESRVRKLLGPPPESFERSGQTVWVYELKGFRYDVVFARSQVVEVNLAPTRLRSLQNDAAAYGVGRYGTVLPGRIQLAVDGVSLGMSEAEVAQLKGSPDPRLTGPVLAYGLGLPTMVEYGPRGARSVLGSRLLRDGGDWAQAGMPAAQVQKRLAEVARLRTQSATVVSYTFLQFGEVRMRIEDDRTVGAFELVEAHQAN